MNKFSHRTTAKKRGFREYVAVCLGSSATARVHWMRETALPSRRKNCSRMRRGSSSSTPPDAVDHCWRIRFIQRVINLHVNHRNIGMTRRL
ncbi:hypothetical protein J6590_050461 [Homalodisca vitripennis]|nr:hypothetical protein J6590_092483 [Homalodisca vitripennis]KAG8266163.1 hypothetical protein J6590_077901 [Homalodisca vitripennis]KAG8321213.1 hypothetical protein J6590_050461 [Homalodisca vitripennis]